jgi:hypothetical protein
MATISNEVIAWPSKCRRHRQRDQRVAQAIDPDHDEPERRVVRVAALNRGFSRVTAQVQVTSKIGFPRSLAASRN